MKIQLRLIYLLFLCLAFSSCEKGIDLIDVDSTIYLPQSGLSTQTALLGDSEFALGVYKAGVQTKSQDVTVSLEVDKPAFAEFLKTNPEYELLPEDFYNIPSNQVTVSKEHSSFIVQLKNIDENFVDKNYVLPISIVGTTPAVKVNEGKATAFLHFQRFRNVYEGEYKVYGTKRKVENGVTIGKIDEVISSISTGHNSITIPGVENGMKLNVTIQDNNVSIAGASGSESFTIKNSSQKSSTYNGEYDPILQRNIGIYKLFYSYVLNGVEIEVELELKSWQ